MKQNLDEIVKTLQGANNILVACHVFPDGDALGSQLALGEVLESLGKNVFLYGEDAVTHLYDFLPGSERIITMLPDLRDFDCAVALDCGDNKRLGQGMDLLLAIHPFIVIDHHFGHKDFGDMRWVDHTRSSTGEMVYELIMAMGADISKDVAFCLYTAIVSDSGSFKYASTSAETFRIAGELVEKGVKPAKVAGKLFDNFTVNRLQLLNEVLATLQLHCNDKLAVIRVTREMFERTNAIKADTETFINYPRSLKTVKIAIFLKEAENGLIAVSLRSKGKEYDVARIAGLFSGGGHRNAAGFKRSGVSLDEVERALLAEVAPLLGAG